MPRGALIVFEGAEGVGKTTQIGLLVSRMRATGVPHLSLREPGGTPLGDEIRRLLLDPEQRIVSRAEALLFMASRAQLVDDVVIPAIQEGQFVLTDRFFLSTYAYQVAGRGLDEAAIRMANQFATAGVIPDLTVLLDLPDGAGMARAAARGDQDRIEGAGDVFHASVARAFREFAMPSWQLAHQECGPIALVSAEGSADEVADRVWSTLGKRWPETFSVSVTSHS
jgi:dTMP kinase